MTGEATLTRRPAACARVSDALAEPLFATAPEEPAWLLLEHPGPWGRDVLEQGAFGPDAVEMLVALRDRLGLRIQLIRRFGERPGNGRRAVFLARMRGERTLERRDVADLSEVLEQQVWDAVARGESFGEPVAEPMYLVCTHARRDACCAEKGRALARLVTHRRPGRVWECSHLGGHRFAANLAVLPVGSCFGRVTPERIDALLGAVERGQVLLREYRGRCGVASAVQAAEHFVRKKTGARAVDAYSLSSLTETRVDETLVVLRDRRRTSYTVRVERVRLEPARPTSCGGAPAFPLSWALRTLATEHAAP